jgi:hypothetical protein
MANEVHLYDIGTVFELTLKDGAAAADISAFTTRKFRFQRPSGDCEIVDATFVTDGTDGKLEYTTVSGDIDETGMWNLQARITDGSGNRFHSEVVEFEVFTNICDASDP